MSAVLRRALGAYVDPTEGDAVAARLRAAAQRGDWPAVRGLLAGVTDPDDASFYVHVVGDVPDVEKWLATVVRDEPYDTTGLLLYGYRMTILAWQARTNASASQVSQDRWRLFAERLATAEDVLGRVVIKEPDNVTAWYSLLVTSRGLGLGVDETGRRFNEVVSRHPGHLRAHQQMLQQLCLKWGGSHEAMYAFAREAMTRAPAGSPLGSLVAMAHLEYWLHTGTRWMELFVDKRHFRAPDVRAELRAAADRSVRHPDYRRRPGWARVHNEFAMALTLAGDRFAAAEQFRAIGPHLTSVPWQYLYPQPGWPWTVRGQRGISYLLGRTDRRSKPDAA